MGIDRRRIEPFVPIGGRVGGVVDQDGDRTKPCFSDVQQALHVLRPREIPFDGHGARTQTFQLRR
jgi:hypothetical protein